MRVACLAMVMLGRAGAGGAELLYVPNVKERRGLQPAVSAAPGT